MMTASHCLPGLKWRVGKAKLGYGARPAVAGYASLSQALALSEDYRGGANQDARSFGGSATAVLDELEFDIDTKEMDELGAKEGAYEDLGEADDAEKEGDDFRYDPPKRTKRPLERPRHAADKVEQELRRRGLGEDPMVSNIVDFARWRRRCCSRAASCGPSR
jgi:hypothetical protein